MAPTGKKGGGSLITVSEAGLLKGGCHARTFSRTFLETLVPPLIKEPDLRLMKRSSEHLK